MSSALKLGYTLVDDAGFFKNEKKIAHVCGVYLKIAGKNYIYYNAFKYFVTYFHKRFEYHIKILYF